MAATNQSGFRMRQRVAHSGRDREICKDLNRIAAFAAFGKTEFLLAGVTEPSGEPGQKEERCESGECSWTSARK